MLPDCFAICAVSHLPKNVPHGVDWRSYSAVACLADLESGAGDMV
jgi:hypothetical protein